MEYSEGSRATQPWELIQQNKHVHTTDDAIETGETQYENPLTVD